MIKKLTFILFLIHSFMLADCIIYEEISNPDVSKAILEGLEHFNIKYFKQKDPTFELETFVIYAKDENSQIIGGLHGYFLLNSTAPWAHVVYFWVDENKRNQGIGTQLYRKFESYAQTKSCRYIQLYTYSFQAPDFYKKLGFEELAVTDNYIGNDSAIFLRKYLNDTP